MDKIGWERVYSSSALGVHPETPSMDLSKGEWDKCGAGYHDADWEDNDEVEQLWIVRGLNAVPMLMVELW